MFCRLCQLLCAYYTNEYAYYSHHYDQIMQKIMHILQILWSYYAYDYAHIMHTNMPYYAYYYVHFGEFWCILCELWISYYVNDYAYSAHYYDHIMQIMFFVPIIVIILCKLCCRLCPIFAHSMQMILPVCPLLWSDYAHDYAYYAHSHDQIMPIIMIILHIIMIIWS